MKIYWVSRHNLSPVQQQAIRDLHGADAEVVKDPVTMESDEGLAEYIRKHSDGFVYAVASGIHYLAAGFVGLRYGIFLNHPTKRLDGQFGLAAVLWVNYPESGKFQRVWVNADPQSDSGEALVPVAR